MKKRIACFFTGGYTELYGIDYCNDQIITHLSMVNYIVELKKYQYPIYIQTVHYALPGSKYKII